jgi:hypothetical protein
VRATTDPSLPCRDFPTIEGPIPLGKFKNRCRVRCSRLPRSPLLFCCAEVETTELGEETRCVWVRAVAFKDGIFSDVKVFEYRLRSQLSQWWTTLPDYLRKYQYTLHKAGYDTLEKVTAVLAQLSSPHSHFYLALLSTWILRAD